MAEHPIISEKVRGEYLRGLFGRRSEEPVTVLIELALPEPEVKTREITRGGVSMHLPVEVLRQPDERRRKEQLIKEGHKLLAGRVVSPPNWLESAGVFVVTATPQRLNEIAASPVVKAIWPNRELRNYAV
jgi:hypothetical protein